MLNYDHALDGAYMGPTDLDSTGKLFELLASAFRNTIKGIPPKMWWPNI